LERRSRFQEGKTSWPMASNILKRVVTCEYFSHFSFPGMHFSEARM
jgi:hypothetical protein